MSDLHSSSWKAVCSVGLIVVVGFAAVPFEAKAYTYTINKSQSYLNLTASGSALGGALIVTEQFPDPPTPYFGTEAVTFPGGVFPGGSINFPGGSAATADVMRGGILNLPRQVAPAVGGGAGTAPANYGLIFTAEANYVIPPIPYPDPNNPINVGKLTGFEVTLALRDLVLDIDSPSPMGLSGTSQFDATGTSISLVSGFADIKGSLVLDQDNLLTTLAVYAVLQGLVAAYPDYGLSVGVNLLNSSVSVGIGTRVDLSGISDFLGMPNTTTTLGQLTFNPVTQYSTLTLPITLDLPDFGLPPEILDLNLRLDGRFVATATLPEPTTLVLLGLPIVGLLRRRR